MTAVLGMSAYFHDAAAALVVDGRVVAAAQEERWSRMKADPRLPVEAARACVAEAGLAFEDLDLVVFHDFEDHLLPDEMFQQRVVARADMGDEITAQGLELRLAFIGDVAPRRPAQPAHNHPRNFCQRL